MICDIDNVIDTVVLELKNSINEKSYGDFGFTVSVRAGNFKKITRIHTVNVFRKSDTLVDIKR